MDTPPFERLYAQFSAKLRQLPRVQRLLASSDVEERVTGVRVLGECGENAEAAPLVFECLLHLLEDPDADVRETAEYQFNDLGPSAFGLLHQILPRAVAADVQVAIHIVRAIGHFHYREESRSLWPAATQELAALLEHESPELRGATARTMADLEFASPAFIDRVLQMCRSPELAERRGALMALRDVVDSNPNLGPQMQRVFLDALNQSDRQVKEAVEWALRDRGRQVLPELVARLNDENPVVRANVLATLSQFSTEDVDEVGKRKIALRICDALCDEVCDVRQAAAFASALGNFEPDTSDPENWQAWLAKCADVIAAVFLPSWRKVEDLTIQRLLEMCSAENPEERGAALHAFYCLGNRRRGRRFDIGQRVVAENLAHTDENVREWAYSAYRHFDVSADSLVSTFVEGIDDPSCHVTESATRSLLEIAKNGADVSPAIPTLLRLLGRRACDDYGGIYSPFEDACEILMRLPAEQTRQAIDPLVRALASKNPRIVAKAAEALWKLGQRVAESLPRLVELLDSGELHSETFCDVLYRIGPAAAPLMPDLIKLLGDRSWDTQWAAADALGAIASSDPECVQALIKALTHPSGVVRNAAIQALSKIGDEAVPQLIATLRGDDDEAKEMAADALGVLGPAADEAADVLRPLLASEAEGVADWSAIALGKIAGTDEALPRLMTIIRERQGRNIRVQAAEALGNIGPKARTALPLLHSALDDPDEDFRHAVEGAIAFIEDEV